MSIPETFEFDNRGEVVKKHWFRPYFLSLVLALVALLSFGVGRLTALKRDGVSVNFDPSLTNSALITTKMIQETSKESGVVASVNGTRYYYSHCGNNISEKNKVIFATALLAEEAGYTLAANCKLK